MGANFLSYTLFGPYNLSRAKRLENRAIKRLSRFIDVAVRFQELENMVGDEVETEIQALLDEVNIDDSNELHWALSYRDDPARLINELMIVWHDGSSDSAYRRDPLHHDRKIWTAGEMSWGDEPDGFGYQTVAHADKAGILSIFGIG